jgi:hypothetical protein
MGRLELYDRDIRTIRTMKGSGYSEKEIRELVLRELSQLKQEVDRMYVDQLNYIEEVFNGESAQETH